MAELMQPLCRPLTMPVAQVSRAVSQLSPRPLALGTLRSKLTANAGNVNGLWLTDSTSDHTSEWIYLVAGDIAAQYPAYSVVYHPWATTDYGASVNISTGSGANTFHVWNCALSGSTMDNFMGALFPAAVGNLNPDAIVISHGHNYTTLADYVLRGRFVGSLEQIMLEHPTVPIAMVLQNPRRDDALMTQIVDQITEIAQDRGDIELIDVHSLFLSANKDAGLYADSIHPDADGQALFRLAWNTKWNAAPPVSFAGNPAWIATPGTNILANGDFSAFAGATPDSWTKFGNGALTKELATVYPGSPHSVKIVNSTTFTGINQLVDAIPYRGLEVTLRVRERIEVAANLNAGRIRIFDNGSGAPVPISNPGAVGLGGFRELSISGYTVSADATLLGAYIYAHSTNSSAGEIYIDEVMLNVGDIPRGL